MRELYFTILFILSINASYGQNAKKYVFNGVIKIAEEKVGHVGESYLIDIPLSPIKLTASFYNETKMPNKLILSSDSFYPQLKEFNLISPDWDYYADVAKSGPKGGCAEPIPSSIIYKVRREGNKTFIDSAKIQNHNAVITFSNEQIQLENHMVSYFGESYGSVCCPKDAKWDIKPTAEEFIKTHRVKAENTYKRITGKEGEHDIYYTLSNLSITDKLTYILQRLYYMIPDRHLKDLLPPRQIFTPAFIEKKGLMLMQ